MKGIRVKTSPKNPLICWADGYDRVTERTNPPDSIQHQSHGRNTQQEHVEEQHDPLECLTKYDPEKYGASPACVDKNTITSSKD